MGGAFRFLDVLAGQKVQPSSMPYFPPQPEQELAVPTTMLPQQGALQTLVVTAGAVPQEQRLPQTTPPRELLTPE